MKPFTKHLAPSIHACLTRACIAAAIAVCASAFSAEVLVGSASGQRLVVFSSADPSDAAVVSVKGLQPGEEIVGLDQRPATGELYALGSSYRLYTIDLTSKTATAIGSGPFTNTLAGASVGFDFNPTVDRIRLVTDAGVNLRLNPTNGLIVAVDGSLAYATNDVATGITSRIAGAGYINNDTNPATGTVLYDIDAGRDTLVMQNPPNAGTLVTLGPLGVSASSVVGFDVAGSDGTAYASLVLDGDKRAGLYTINLMSGAATFVGWIGGPKPLMSLATIGAE